MDRSRNDHKDYSIQLRRTIAAYLPTQGLPLIGKDRWSDRLLVIVMILLAWSPLPTLQDRFDEARAATVRMYRSRRRPGKTFGGFMTKLARHSARLLALVGGTLRQRMQERSGEQWRIGRWLAFGVDGTKIDCPRTRANQKRFKNSGQRKKSKKNPSGPQLLLVSLIHLGTGLAWSWRHSHTRDSERHLLRQLLGDLPDNALLVADAGFMGYELVQAILAGDRSILMRVGANVHLLEKLGYAVQENNGMVYLWPEKAQHKRLPPLVLQRIVVVDGRNRRMCLLTNVLESRELSDAEAVALYSRRWQVELLFRAMKQILARRKMLSDSPAHVPVELDWSVVGQWLLSLLLWEERREKRPAQEGFAAILRLVRAAMSGRGDGRASLLRQLRAIRIDRYVRRGSKKARHWPHKKNDPPCGVPHVRMARRAEVRLAKRLRSRITIK